MSATWEADNLVAIRSGNAGRYKRSFLRQAVCELKFPTLLELGGDHPPSSFVSALRKDYPTLERTNEVTLGVGVGPSGTSHTHVFRSAMQDWVVSLKLSSFSVETLAYKSFDELKAKILKVLPAAVSVIDTEFFTRVGLRYVNVLDVGEKDVSRWLNPELVAAISPDKFRGVQAYSGKLQLGAPDGGCLLQHGAQPTSKSPDSPVLVDYWVDIDVWRNIVALEDVPAALDALHSQAFDVFDWAIGDDARDYLSSAPAGTHKR